MNILITGATGFLGSHLLPMLLDNGHTVIILKRTFSDLRMIKSYLSHIKCYDIDKDALDIVFNNENIDVIIYLATNYGKNPHRNITEILESNINLPSKLLNIGIENGIQGFINTDTDTNLEYSLYSATKKAFGDIAKFFAANYDLKIVNLKLETLYGQNDHNNHFIPLVIERTLNNKNIKTTKGDQKRDFVFVEDVAHAYIATLKNFLNFKKPYTEINIGSGKIISLKKIVATVEILAGKKTKIDWGAIPYSKNEIFDKTTDIKAAKKLLDWIPQTSLEKGLKNTIRWHIEQQK